MTITNISAAHNEIQTYVNENGDYLKGFATIQTATKSKKVGAAIAEILASEFAFNLQFVSIAEGKHAGRVVPCLCFGKGATLSSRVCSFMHRGILLFSPN